MQKNTLCYSLSDIEDLKKSLNIFTPFTGYVYLLDGEGRIRWDAHGNPTAKEIESLTVLPGELLKKDSN